MRLFNFRSVDDGLLGHFRYLKGWINGRLVLLTLVFVLGLCLSVLVQWLAVMLSDVPGERYPRYKSRQLRSTDLTSDLSRIPAREHLEVGDDYLKYSRTLDHSASLYGASPKISTVRKNPALEIEALASLRLALVMRKEGKEPKALKLLQHAYALCPTHPDILIHYGEFLEEHNEDIVEAEHLYARALTISPGHPRALLNRDRLLPEVEDLDEENMHRIELKRDELGRIPDANAALRRAKKEAYFQHVYHTVGLEGSTMTLAETRSVVETRLAVGGKSVIEHNEILGLDAALAYINSSLVNKLGALSTSDIMDIHRRVMGFVDPIEAGQLRRTQVFVGSHVPPRPAEVTLLLSELVQWLNSEEALSLHPIRLAALAHYKLVFVHPFADGNGRTSRLLMNLIMMRYGYPPVVIRKQDRLRYYRTLELANEGDVRPFIRFIAQCTEGTLNFYLQATKEYPVPELDNWKETPKIIGT